jgi:xylulokinase
MKDVLIGVDVGTQGVKAVACTPRGVTLASAFRASQLHRPATGAVEEDPEFQVASAFAVIRECVRKAAIAPGAVAGIAFVGQMAGVIGVGADGRNVTPYDSWLDGRCAPQIHRMQQEAGGQILVKTGCAPSFNHGPKILRWKTEFPQVYARIHAFVQPGAYVAMRCCGLGADHAFIDTTYLHFSGFADTEHTKWDAGLCRRFGVARAKLPRIVLPHEKIGTLTADAARRCGLAAGTPVVAGCGDTAASFLACGATRQGVCVDVAGTASVFAGTTQSFQPDRRHGTMACGHAATPGLWHPYAYINGGGMNLEWFRREIANRGRTRGQGLLSFDALNVLAEQVMLDPALPLFVPHLAGRVCPSQPGLRGTWSGLNWSHGIGTLYRAVLEGVALEYRLYAEILGELYPNLPLREVRVTGGGGKSAFWNQIKADVLCTPVVQVTSGGAPMGAALIAGYGVGAIKDVAKAAETWIEKGVRTPPIRSRRAYYTARFHRYQALLEALLALETITNDEKGE